MAVFSKELGKKIHIERIKKDLNQDQLAKGCGVSQSYLSKVEKGAVQISVIKLIVIARALNCSVSDLLVDIDCLVELETE